MNSRVRRSVGLLGIASFALLWGCPLFSGGRPGNENENDNTAENENVAENENENAGERGERAALPAKSIGFDLIGIHDPDSDSYNGDCVGCHGDRLNEVALDGDTPSAHSTMLTLFGSGNDRCISCHQSGPSFLTLSRGALREQVDIEAVNCVGCHGVNAVKAFYAK